MTSVPIDRSIGTDERMKKKREIKKKKPPVVPILLGQLGGLERWATLGVRAVMNV